MRKRFGKFIGLAAVACMMMSTFGGCGTKNTNTNAGTETAEQDAAENVGETEEKNTTEGEEVAQGSEDTTVSGGDTYKIGGIGPITGAAAIYGQAVENAAILAVNEINEAGGINGYQIEFKFEDDEHDAEKAINAYNSLKDWGMQILMGAVTSSPTTAVAAKSVEDNMFQLSPSATAVDCIANDNAFRVCFSDPSQGKASATYIGENGLASKVAIIYDSSDIYSSGICETFIAEAENQNFEIVTTEAFTADNKTDFTVQLQSAKDAGADMIFLPIYYTEASLILAQANTMGLDISFFGCDGLDGILTVENFDTSLAEGVMLLTPFVATASDEATQNFVTAYQEAYGDIPNQFAADTYDAIYAIKAALEKSGVTPDTSVSDTCEAMKTAMTEITLDGLTGTITWSADGEPNKEPKAMVIVDGTYQPMD